MVYGICFINLLSFASWGLCLGVALNTWYFSDSSPWCEYYLFISIIMFHVLPIFVATMCMTESIANLEVSNILSDFK